MSNAPWILYGANGYTGRVILAHALAVGERPVLAGRREDAIRPLAEAHGLEYRIFALDGDPAALEGAGALLLAAGPFSATSAPALTACLAAGAHYVDIAGEFAVFEAAQARDAAAKARGVTVLPGAGFDVVPSDCLAVSLHNALPGARRLTLAIAVMGEPGPGSIKTAVEGAADGGWIRRGGVLQRVPAAWGRREIPFAGGVRPAMTIPWGDLSSAYWSTRIPDIEVYMATPRAAIAATRLSRPFAAALRNARVQAGVKALVDKLVTGGADEARAAGKSWVWGSVEDAEGRRVTGDVQTLETTTLTAHTTVDIVRRLLRGEARPGYTTPALAFGPDYIRGFPSTTMTLEEIPA